ncbi:uncharacterized protein G2W53_024985 [Senna tora]|uniref:Uncharacterized protein n=1 Tax=Senna tora TaxID=362788 RepID=A0A834WDN8_9FABA|nr:uncharacterized protein G2W53_024985 [Senna tora]
MRLAPKTSRRQRRSPQKAGRGG